MLGFSLITITLISLVFLYVHYTEDTIKLRYFKDDLISHLKQIKMLGIHDEDEQDLDTLINYIYNNTHFIDRVAFKFYRKALEEYGSRLSKSQFMTLKMMFIERTVYHSLIGIELGQSLQSIYDQKSSAVA